MIPKKIHYCWFGGQSLPELAVKCIESWKRHCPDYEIIQWNETNYHLDDCVYVREAYEAGKWAFVSDYVRLDVIFREGGIYLDTDVEVIRSLDSLLNQKCFFAEETTSTVGTGLGFGSEKGNKVIEEMLFEYKGKHFKLAEGIYDTTPCPRRNTEVLLRYGYQYSALNIWSNDNITVYPPEFFCPMDSVTGELTITPNTYSIHHYSALWISDGEKQLEQEISKMEKTTFFLRAFWKRNYLRYKFQKENGDVDSLRDYLIKKVKVRLINMIKKKW